MQKVSEAKEVTESVIPSVQLDELRELLKTAEDMFYASGFIAPAGVPMPMAELWWKRRNGDWCFTVLRPGGEECALVKEKLHLRIEATKHLSALWQACESAREGQKKEVVESIDRLRKFILQKRGIL